MAMMKYREPNQVRRVGVRPAHNGTFTSGSGFQNAVAWNNFYTVPANRRLYIFHSALSAFGIVTTGDARMRIVYGGVVHYFHYCIFDVAGNFGYAVDTSHYFPFELNAGDTVGVYVSAVGISCFGLFNGFLEVV